MRRTIDFVGMPGLLVLAYPDQAGSFQGIAQRYGRLVLVVRAP